MDNYNVGQSLGSGHFGETRKCKIINTNVVRAVKILIKTQMGPQDGFITQRFFHELEITKRLDHPNILKLHECYED